MHSRYSMDGVAIENTLARRLLPTQGKMNDDKECNRHPRASRSRDEHDCFTHRAVGMQPAVIASGEFNCTSCSHLPCIISFLSIKVTLDPFISIDDFALRKPAAFLDHPHRGKLMQCMVT